MVAFTHEQQRYLEGFAVGLKTQGRPKPHPEPAGPDAAHLAAMARFEAAGRTLANEESAKREQHPFDAYARLKAEAEAGRFPRGIDNFRWRFHGLFYVAPAQDSFMCRLRIPNGILTHWQLRGIADLAAQHAGGYAHVTTRANLQLREIGAAAGPPVLERLIELGITSKGAGADNIRNVTGSPTAGIDPHELIDTRPYARAWHHHILNDRGLYGLPRKFNVGFDGGGQILVLEDTNDIAFTAVKLDGEVWFRLGLGGITGHQAFARPTGVIVAPKDAVAVADAIVRVYIDHGDRTDRKKARLKYLLDAWGVGRFLAEVESRLGRPLTRVPANSIATPNRQNRLAHIGVHPQKQPGLAWIGVALPVGKMTAAQMRGIADVAYELGDGDIRLTVWQNLLISGVATGFSDGVQERLRALGLTCRASSIRAGLIACTGNTGCKFAASDTKGTALAIAEHVEPRMRLDSPVNIHITGCPNSCAQHYIGDIGLLATRVPAAPGSDDTVEAFTVYVGGGFGADAAIGRELYRDIRAEECPRLIERVLGAYLAHRDADETFLTFTRRHDVPALRSMVDACQPSP